MTTADDRDGDRIELLLVEPNPGDTRLFTESFRDGKLANNLHTVSDGESAIDFVRQRGEYADAPRPDLVLLEPELPGVGASEVLSELRGEPAVADVPVVVLSSSDAGEQILRSRGLDADHIIQKPIEPGEFIEFVQSVEDFWLAIIEQPSADD
ncbi:Response regulator receiver domain-containing protein [Halomicrobium zhouii]|uniref:Response regulator receiver domain-containing protein n=1 Tax=Halomicrobium zhouii TaxID=767519 RepID=A0A1I6L7S3_9EURY|nr:response regulator [Halomicrobium zhouii]SFR99288.1 Response regulator receiver domain-containing protein [Halomicrobium zhouii]